MFFWITFWLLQVFVQMWKHIEYYNVHHDYVDGFDDEEEEEEEEENDDDDDDDDFDTDLEDEDEDENVKPLASEEAVKEEEQKEEEDKEEDEKEENKNEFLTEEEFVREFVQILKRNIDDGDYVYDDSWLYQSLRREIN